MHRHCSMVENSQAFYIMSELSTTPMAGELCWQQVSGQNSPRHEHNYTVLVLKTPNYSLSSGPPPTSKAKLTEQFALKKQAAPAIPYLYYFVVICLEEVQDLLKNCSSALLRSLI